MGGQFGVGHVQRLVFAIGRPLDASCRNPTPAVSLFMGGAEAVEEVAVVGWLGGGHLCARAAAALQEAFAPLAVQEFGLAAMRRFDGVTHTILLCKDVRARTAKTAQLLQRLKLGSQEPH